MITALADEFGIPWTDGAVRSTLYATLGTMVGKGGANLVLRWVPVYGNLIRGRGGRERHPGARMGGGKEVGGRTASWSEFESDG